MDYITEYQRWCERADRDGDIIEELQEMSTDKKKIEDAFFSNLVFGTGGLRGVIGAGTNRMNIYTVAKASQGLADYIIRRFIEVQRCVAISYDSRIKSELFARTAAEVFAANGIHVEIYREPMPTPCLSYAVRALKCSAGIMITASHNPAKYNGYKVYGADGCQITTTTATEILSRIEKLDLFNDIKQTSFNTGLKTGMISWIPDDIYIDFVEAVKGQSLLFGDEIDKNVSIVYSPLNGTGLKPVLRTLKESGYTNITVVKEQADLDGNFPTCPYPNPEIKEAMSLGIEYAERVKADLLLATDPDCDRVGIAVKNDKGEMQLLSGNEAGILLLDYICSQRMKHGEMPENPIIVKTIVTTNLAESIAEKYGVRTVNVLTGFKFIGEQIGKLEAKGKQKSYIFGFEESYGYLSGGYVRDKDAVDGAYLICEMFSFYKTRGINLLDKLEELYKEYGYSLNTLHSYTFEGSAGFSRMQEIMAGFRNNVEVIGSKKVDKILDYSKGVDKLPKSDVLKFILEGNCSVVVRPSGTEPKLKVYFSVNAKSKAEALKIEEQIKKIIEEQLNII